MSRQNGSCRHFQRMACPVGFLLALGVARASDCPCTVNGVRGTWCVLNGDGGGDVSVWCRPFTPCPTALVMEGTIGSLCAASRGVVPAEVYTASCCTIHAREMCPVTQCAVGQRMINFKCRGDALKLNWDEAMSYAEEVRGKTGEPWRLPSKREMPKLLETRCINPAANPFVFPDLEVANFWTASKGLHQDQFRCSVYTYQGRVFCRQARSIEQPFLLVKRDP